MTINPVGASLPLGSTPRPGAGIDVLEQAIQAWERPGEGGDALRDFHFLAVFSFHLVQRFQVEEAAAEARTGRAAAAHRQAHRTLAGRLRRLLDACQSGAEVRRGIEVFLEAWRDHQEGPFHGQGAGDVRRGRQGLGAADCA